MLVRAKHHRLMKLLSQSDKNFLALVECEEASILELEKLELEEAERVGAAGAIWESSRLSWILLL